MKSTTANSRICFYSCSRPCSAHIVEAPHTAVGHRANAKSRLVWRGSSFITIKHTHASRNLSCWCGCAVNVFSSLRSLLRCALRRRRQLSIAGCPWLWLRTSHPRKLVELHCIAQVIAHTCSCFLLCVAEAPTAATGCQHRQERVETHRVAHRTRTSPSDWHVSDMRWRGSRLASFFANIIDTNHPRLITRCNVARARVDVELETLVRRVLSPTGEKWRCCVTDVPAPDDSAAQHRTAAETLYIINRTLARAYHVAQARKHASTHAGDAPGSCVARLWRGFRTSLSAPSFSVRRPSAADRPARSSPG
jgi:hypothetical protein|eukprot:COSAG06_NODE_5048_length_3760_cov_7.083311_2_plen_307_part_00